MNSNRARCAMIALQWTLGLVILVESSLFAFAPGSAHAFANTGLPDVIRLVVAYAEIGAAVLFLLPRTLVAGAWLLIGVLAFAIVLHLLHGWWNVGALLVYGVAAWT